MNKQNYINSLEKLKISEDFNKNTAKLMKEARDSMKNNNKNQSNKNSSLSKRIMISAASLAVIAIAGAATVSVLDNRPAGQTTSDVTMMANVTPDADVTLKSSAGITVPFTEIPEQNTQISARMLPLFVYKGNIYVQSNTGFLTGDDGFTPVKEDVMSLRGDYLGKTTGNINEWSTQDDYATEFASTIGEADIYTVKGYDSNHRLMAYYEWEGGFGAEIYDCFGGLTLNTGADYFNLLNLKDNIETLNWESFDSWNNGLLENEDTSVNDTFNSFLDSLYTSQPIGNDIDMLLENSDNESQKFITITTKDNLVTTLRLVKGGYVYDSQVGFFKVDEAAFNAFWDTLLVTPAAKEDTTQNENTINPDIAITMNEASLPVNVSDLTLTLVNNGQEDVYYGADYSIEKLNGLNWEAVPSLSDMMFIDIAYTLTAGSSQEFTIDLSSLTPALDAGNYRVVKTINGETFYAEFELTK